MRSSSTSVRMPRPETVWFWLTPSAINWQLSASPYRSFSQEHVGKSEIQTTPSLKNGPIRHFAEGKRLDVPEAMPPVVSIPSTGLCRNCDACYALTLRKRLVETGIPQVQVLRTGSEFCVGQGPGLGLPTLRDTHGRRKRSVKGAMPIHIPP